MRLAEVPNLVGELVGVVDLGNNINIDDIDFLIRRNIRLEKTLFGK
jgi:hypothetical protein